MELNIWRPLCYWFCETLPSTSRSYKVIGQRRIGNTWTLNRNLFEFNSYFHRHCTHQEYHNGQPDQVAGPSGPWWQGESYLSKWNFYRAGNLLALWDLLRLLQGAIHHRGEDDARANERWDGWFLSKHEEAGQRREDKLRVSIWACGACINISERLARTTIATWGPKWLHKQFGKCV